MVQRPPSDEMRIGGQPLDCEGDGLDPSVRRSSPCERANRTQLAMSAFVLRPKGVVGKFEKKFEKDLFEVCDVCCCCKHVVRIPADLERAFDKPALWKLILDQTERA